MKKFLNSVASGFAGGAAYILFPGNYALAGMVAGGVSAALNGGHTKDIVKGVILGGAMGTIASTNYYVAIGMAVAGAGVAYAQGGLDGLSYYAGGIAGGMAGAAVASDLTTPELQSGQPIADDPLLADGKRLTATDAEGNTIDSWKMASGKRGTAPADQWVYNEGPTPEGSYSVDPSKIQRWSDLSFGQKMAAQLGLGEWPGGVPSWGHYRVPIQTPSGGYYVTNGIVTRGNLFIHGGWELGSRGCIDVSFGEVGFFNYLSGQNAPVPLTVKYGGQ